MEELTIFPDITPQEQQAMHTCFRSREVSFSAEEIIMAYTRTPQKIPIIFTTMPACFNKKGYP